MNRKWHWLWAVAACCTGPAGAGADLPLAQPSTAWDIRRDATVEAVARVLPSVVNIGTRKFLAKTPYERWQEQWYGFGGQPKARYARGSGVVVSEDGYVLTNTHVVGDADDIWVTFYNESETNAIPAERVVVNRTKDVALLRLKPKSPRAFRPVKFAKDDDLFLGETVLALGNPFGLEGSVSRGILSSKPRRAPGTTGEGEPLDIEDWLQTDASINPGNSGGPLVNVLGELIGLNVAVIRPEAGAQGLGFAIPIQQVNEALAEVLSGESIGPAGRQYWFGARLQPLMRPLTIGAVQEGSPAEDAGLKAGDVILSVDGNPAGSIIDFNRALLAAGEGRSVRLLLRHAGKTREASLSLVLESRVFNNDLIRRRLGLTILLAPAGSAFEGAYQVATVEPKGPAATAGLRPGIALKYIDGQAVDSLVSAAKLVSSRPPGDRVSLGLIFLQDAGFAVMARSKEVSVRLR